MRIPQLFIAVLIVSILAALSAIPAVAEPLARFTMREIVGQDWPQTLVTYALELPAGKAQAEQLRVVDDQGKEIVHQLSRVTLHPDGSLATARLSFKAALPSGATANYQLLPEKPTAPGKTITAGDRDGYLTLDNGIVALRLSVEGELQPSKPLLFSTDRSAMSLGNKQVEQGIIPGPVQGLRLADGRWTGGSFFWAGNTSKAPKMIRYVSRLTDRGPLFAEAAVRYEFDNGGSYQLTARVLADDPAVRIDEQYDLKELGPGGTYRVVIGLNAEHWQPDYAFQMACIWSNRSPLQERASGFEEALKRVGAESKSLPGDTAGSVSVDYSQPRSELMRLSVWPSWSPEAAFFVGFADSKLMTGPADPQHPIPFVGVVPMHAGNWRGANQAHNTSVICSHKPGGLDLHWPLLVEPNPFSMTDTGEYDPALPPTFGRRQWALIGGPLQNREKLFAFRAYEGFVNLDDYKDWVIDWPDSAGGAVTEHPRLLLSRKQVETMRPGLDKHPAVEQLKDRLYFHDNEERAGQLTPGGVRAHLLTALNSGYAGAPWQSTYRQTQASPWAIEADEFLSSAKATPEARRAYRALIAAFCHMMAEPDLNPRGSMIHLGNPNMPVNRFMALPVAASLIPDHPRSKEWLDVSASYLRHKLARNMAPGGVWGELISYFQASQPAMLYAGSGLRSSDRLDDPSTRLLILPSAYTVHMMTPKDPRFGCRFMPNWGHEGAFVHTHWLAAAGIIRDLDPELAKSFVWCWDQMSRPTEDNQDLGGWTNTTIAHADLLNHLPADYLPPQLKSVWLPGFGAVLRAHAADPDETYLAYRQGYVYSHSDDNQGDFVLYSKGAPLSTLCLFQYGVQYNDSTPFHQLWKTFGWHNRPRFGSQDNRDNFGPLSQVHAYAFNDSTDYLRGNGESGPNNWVRQVLFLKSKQAAGPNYFVFRETSVASGAGKLQPKWWTLRTPGTKDQLKTTSSALEFTSEFGTGLQVHFVEPASVEIASQQATQQGPVYNRAYVNWVKQGRPVQDPKGATGGPIDETMTVSLAGPIAAGQDITVALYPHKPGETMPTYESLAPGVAKITTSEGQDYVFANRQKMSFEQGDIAFEGLAGAVRLYPEEVHLVIAEGPGLVRYKGTTLRSDIPAHRIIKRQEVDQQKTIVEPPLRHSLQFSLDEKNGKIDEVEPGVKRQTLTNGFAYAFDSEQPVKFEHDGVSFSGRRGGVVVDNAKQTVRLVVLDGDNAQYQKLRAHFAKGPWDLTFLRDRVIGKTAGDGRILYVTTPEGIQELPELVIDGLPFMPGSVGRETLIVPLMPGEHTFEIHALEQPPIWRNWQAW